MAEFPVSLDSLISHVKALHPAGGPLENLSDAVTVGGELDEQSDALIGHFVDQARRSGATWSQIGASMGVSKQAAQKRFVVQWQSADFSRFTQRARNALAAAGRTAAASGADVIDPGHLSAGLLSEPDGLAARVIHGAGLSDEQVLTELGLPPDPGGPDADADTLRELRFTEAGRAALRATVSTALRMRHNYIGTEHLLLGILVAEDGTRPGRTGLGLTAAQAEQALADEFARIQAQRRVSDEKRQEEEPK
jgi:Clp amino terminal domain, pathogenicity island component